MLNQFSRTELLYGKAVMEHFQKSRVAVFGIGGVGGYAVEALARSGIGTLDLIDDDKVCITNLNRQLFALRSAGTSMINAGILDGDIVVVAKTNLAENGEIVVALVSDEATVKRFYKESGHFRLQPENPSMEPILVDEVYILGKVVAVLRYYK